MRARELVWAFDSNYTYVVCFIRQTVRVNLDLILGQAKIKLSQFGIGPKLHSFHSQSSLMVCFFV